MDKIMFLVKIRYPLLFNVILEDGSCRKITEPHYNFLEERGYEKLNFDSENELEDFIN